MSKILHSSSLKAKWQTPDMKWQTPDETFRTHKMSVIIAGEWFLSDNLYSADFPAIVSQR
jgi:hypothetical protein